VGTQAAINVMVGERYRQVTDQVIEYALGRWGQEAVEAMDQNIRDHILDRPRAREIASTVLPDPTLDEIRKQVGGTSLSDEDLILTYLTSPEDLTALRCADRQKPYLTSSAPLVELIAGLVAHRDCNHVHVRKGETSVLLEKRSG
jgi:oxaloacetate decarboxylase alpha subunit